MTDDRPDPAAAASPAAPPPPPHWEPGGRARSLRERTANVDIGDIRAVTAVVGALFGAFLVFAQGISIADGEGVGPQYALMYRANAVMRWTLPAASLACVASFLPLFPRRGQRAFVWVSLALTVGSIAGWVSRHLVARHGS